MAKLSIVKGTTSFICHIFIPNTSSTNGAGLTGLTNASAGLICYYMRAGAAADVSVSINTISTFGTYAGDATHAAFKELDSANMPGVYELHLPNNALATGANQVIIMLNGAANMPPVLLEIQLTSLDLNTATVSLGSAGMDNVTVETGVNARQALSLVASALAGVLAGGGTTSITIAAANNSGTNRITATVDANGNRSALVLNIPA